MEIILLSYVVVAVVEIILINKMIKLEKNWHWNCILGIFFANMFAIAGFIFNIFSTLEYLDTNDALVTLFFSIVYFLINLILLGVAMGKRKGIAKTKLYFVLIAIVLAVYYFIILGVVPKKSLEDTNKSIERTAVEYLTKKYGDQNFEAVDVRTEYNYNGFVASSIRDYDVAIRSSRGVFHAYVGASRSGVNEGGHYSGDGFLEQYYGDLVAEKLAPEFDVDVELEIYHGKIPNDFGHFPSFDEILALDALGEFQLESDATKRYDFDGGMAGRMEYLKNMTLNIVDILDIQNDIALNFYRPIGTPWQRYDMKKEGDILTISNREVENDIYVFNLSESDNSI